MDNSSERERPWSVCLAELQGVMMKRSLVYLAALALVLTVIITNREQLVPLKIKVGVIS